MTLTRIGVRLLVFSWLTGVCEAMQSAQVCSSGFLSICDYPACTQWEGNGPVEHTCGDESLGAYNNGMVCAQVQTNEFYSYWWPCEARTTCPPGFFMFSSVQGNVKYVDCQTCAWGVYQSADTAATVCTKCEAGKYSRDYGLTTCVECPAGKYQSLIGQSKCEACLAGSYQSGGGGSSCKACDRGTYQSATGQEVCTGCALGSSSQAVGASSSNVCAPCTTGRYQDKAGGASCQSCDSGKYQGLGGQSSCDECPAGSSSYATGAGSSSVCELCSKGKYQNGKGSVSCKACGSGAYQSIEGSTMCDGCPPGSISREYGAVSSALCLLCAAGTYQTGVAMGECLECMEGTYASGEGSNSAGHCLECDGGTYSSDGGRSACELCPPGRHQPSNGATSCLECPFGLYSTGAGAITAEECSPCPLGTISPLPGLEDRTCKPCPPGQRQESFAQTECEACWAGSYSTKTGGSSIRDCTVCEVGTYGILWGATACTRCLPGTYQGGIMKTYCDPCSSGKYASASGSSTCLNCSVTNPSTSEGGVGWYKDSDCSPTRDKSWKRCTVCPEKTVRACTETMDTECQRLGLCNRGVPRRQPGYEEWMAAEYKCKQGQFLSGFRNASSKDCRPCPINMVGRNGVFCEWCDGPMEEPYWLDQASCVCKPFAVMTGTGKCVCPDGFSYYSDFTPEESLKEEGCAPCPPNTYGIGGDCKFKCEAGTYSGYGSTACEACPAGKYRQNDTSVCQACNSTGTYAPDPSVAVCVACSRSCTEEPGWREAGTCPGEGNEKFKVCAPCDDAGALPSNAKWIGTCVLECNPGFYYRRSENNTASGGGECVACSTEPCPAGYTGELCTADADRGCEEECRNESKPMFYSKWAAAERLGRENCPWECEDGYAAVVSDYWMFQILECVRE